MTALHAFGPRRAAPALVRAALLTAAAAIVAFALSALVFRRLPGLGRIF